MQVVEAVARRPRTASVRLSFAGASRTTGASRRGRASAVTRSRGSRVRGRPGDRPERLAQREPLPDRERLGAPVAAMPHAASAASTRVARRPGAGAASTLWSILRRSRNAGLDDPPEAVLRRPASRRSSAAYGSSDEDRRLDLGRGLERLAAARRNATRAFAWYWTNTDR